MSDFQVTGQNAAAPFSLKIHRGEGMVLLGMDWKNGRPPDDFVGFAIQYRAPGSDRFFNVRNRIGFPGQRPHSNSPNPTTLEAPVQKFRWVHVPSIEIGPGAFTYRVTAMFMNAQRELQQGEAQEATLDLLRETIPGKLNVTFTRGYVSSQAFVARYGDQAAVSTIVAPNSKDGLTFVPTHADAAEAHDWMGFEARTALLDLLDEAKARGAEVRAIVYDLNLPEVLARFKALGGKLRIIIDDSAHHRDADAPETIAQQELEATAGAANVKRQHMANLQHHKSIAVRAPGFSRVVYGSTNYTWRGFFVQSNNAVIVHGDAPTDDYFAAFDHYFGVKSGGETFRNSASAKGWADLALPGVEAKRAFSPHNPEDGVLQSIADDIDAANSSVMFSLAFLGQMTKGAIGPALGRALNRGVHCIGIADARVSAGNLGVTVMSPDQQRRIVRAAALTGNVPAPFRTEPTGLAGVSGNERGTRMHHKFLVLDFDKPTARVYLGSYNFSEPADLDNGENLMMVKDRTVATAYMIEAVRIYDHYRFRTANSESLGTSHRKLELRFPPGPGEEAWFSRDWDDPVRARDRVLFA